MAVPVFPPGASSTTPTSNINGTVAPITSGATWEFIEKSTSTVLGSSVTPNGYAASISGGVISVTIPSGASQGGGPARYNLRFSSAYMASVS